MKCKACGGNFPSRELHCPYCGAENKRGFQWQRQRDIADREYDLAREEQLPIARLLALHKVLNRILKVELVLLALFVAGLFAAFFLMDAGVFNGKLFFDKSIEGELEALYETRDFDGLYRRLDETDSFDQEHYAYCQMALIYRDYESFCVNRALWYQEREEGDPSEYTASFLVGDMHDLFYFDISAYPELTETNRMYLAEYQQDAEVFAREVLGFTDAQLELLQKQDWLRIEEEDALAAVVLERGAQYASE